MAQPANDPSGRHVLITGGARGIGLATAKAFLTAGARVAIGDIDAELATQQAKDIGAFSHHVDVTDKASFAQLLDAAEDALGPLDVLINNAGTMPLGPLQEEPDEVTSRIVSINLLGVINGTKLAMDRMIPRRTGHIVNVSSAVGRVAVPHAATYSATKFAVVGLTQAVRGELRGTGVQASAILPAIVNTDLGSGLHGGRSSRVVQPEDVAAAIVNTVRRPRFESWVPRSNYIGYRAMSMLPRGAFEAVGRMSGATDILANADNSARADYEDRARRQSTPRSNNPNLGLRSK